MIKAVIFDWGGVIAPNNDGGWVAAYGELLGLSIEESLPIWREAYSGFNTGKITEAMFWDRTEKLIGRSLPDERHDIWAKGLAINPWHEMLDLVQELKSEGYIVGLLSNTVAPMLENERLIEFYTLFYPVVLSHEVGVSKPSAEIYALMLDKVGLLPWECLFIDDQQANVDGAARAGIHALCADGDPKATVESIRKVLIARD